jgi:protein SCO1/2
MNRRQFFSPASLGAVVTVAAGVALAGTANAAAAPAGRRGPGSRRVPDLPVVDQHGNRFNFHSDLVKGRVVIFNFFYADCDGICPVQTESLKRVYNALGDRMGREVFMYSLTLRPEVDSPQKLAHYAEMHGTGEHWKFLTGSAADMDTLRKQLGFYDPNPEIDADKTSHLGMVRYGVEWLDRWGGCPADSRTEVIVNNVLTLYGPAYSLVPDVA